MTRRATAALLSLAAAWILWAYTFNSYESHQAPGTWTKVLTADSEASCEEKKREQVVSLLDALAPYGATIDKAGNAVFYAARTPDGRPIMKGTRYHCLPETMDPRAESQ
jgi:hypothetical protein